MGSAVMLHKHALHGTTWTRGTRRADGNSKAAGCYLQGVIPLNLAMFAAVAHDQQNSHMELGDGLEGRRRALHQGDAGRERERCEGLSPIVMRLHRLDVGGNSQVAETLGNQGVEVSKSNVDLRLQFSRTVRDLLYQLL